MLKEFREFAVKGNALDLAVGVIIGAAFGQIINSVVNDIFNPVISLLVGKVDFGSWVIGLPGDSVLKIGAFITAVINFLIVAFVVFLMVKQIHRFRKLPRPVELKACPFCLSEINRGASRCPHCTSEVE